MSWRRVLLLVLCGVGAAGGQTRPDDRLVKECNALLATAIVRPYGIAWAPADPGNLRAPLVRYDAGGTVAAGWVLWEAGRICSDPRYSRAAIDVARGIANAQATGGKIPDAVRFGLQDDRGQDSPRFIPGRQSTCASLGLLLTILRDSPKPDVRLRSCALIAARWVARQQTGPGAWPSRDPMNLVDNLRIIRLDNPDCRDSSLALLLAADVLKNRDYSKQVARGGKLLMQIRFPVTDAAGGGCWTGAYGLNLTARSDISDAPLSLDTLASRYCMQTLMAEAVCDGDVNALDGVHAAYKTLSSLREAEGSLGRYYPVSRSATKTVDLSVGADDELPRVLNTVQQLDLDGLSGFGKAIDAQGIGGTGGIDASLARVLCGLGEDLFNPQPEDLVADAATIRE